MLEVDSTRPPNVIDPARNVRQGPRVFLLKFRLQYCALKAGVNGSIQSFVERGRHVVSDVGQLGRLHG